MGFGQVLGGCVAFVAGPGGIWLEVPCIFHQGAAIAFYGDA